MVVVHCCDGEGHGDPVAVVSQMVGLHLLRALAHDRQFVAPALFGPSLSWKEHSDVLTDGFMSQVAVDPLSGPVPPDDGSSEVGHENGVAGRFDDRREEIGQCRELAAITISCRAPTVTAVIGHSAPPRHWPEQCGDHPSAGQMTLPRPAGQPLRSLYSS